MIVAPLVSVIVITYNSSQYILEALNSIKKQTYTNIELIISDDSSSDITVELCQNWIEENGSRFTRSVILTSEENKGVSANCNKGILSSNGEWIKLIAGDDCLIADCIEKYISFVSLKNILICHSKMISYQDEFVDDKKIDLQLTLPKPFFTLSPNSRKQFDLLCLSNVIAAPTVFINRKLFELVGLFDEYIPMCEDWPMWLKVTSAGYPFYSLNEYTVQYRVHSSSIFGQASVGLLFKRFFLLDSSIYQRYISSKAPFAILFAQRYNFYLRMTLDFCGFNRNSKICTLLYKFLNLPFQLIYKRVFECE